MHKRLPRKVRVHLAWLCRGEVRLGDGRLLDRPGPGGKACDRTLASLVELLCYCTELTGDDACLDEVTPSLPHLRAVLVRGAEPGGDEHIDLSRAGSCLSALARYAQVSGRDLLDPLDPSIEALSAAAAHPGSDPYLARLAVPLLDVSQKTGSPGRVQVAQGLIRWLQDDRFLEQVFASGRVRDACCAVEGWLHAVERGLVTDQGRGMDVAERLAALQSTRGGLPEGTEACDITARAVRIWQCVDPHLFSREIREGLAFLGGLARKGGGFYQDAACGQIHTHATILAAQAILWTRTRPDPLWIV